MTAKVCLDCPAIGAWPRGRCPDHERARDQARGTKTQRGYGSTILDTPLGQMTYDQCRTEYQRRLDDGERMNCADQCGDAIEPSSWHLGHHNTDRGVIVGPLTKQCNLSAAGKARHGISPNE